MAPSTAAFGAWKSPITTDVLAGQSTTLESVAVNVALSAMITTRWKMKGPLLMRS